MNPRPASFAAGVLLLAPRFASAQPAPDRAEVVALSGTFLRDTAELPMEVDVTVVVTDVKGKQKRNARSKVAFVFRGHNGQTGRFSVRSTTGILSVRGMRDSFAPNLAVINALRGSTHGRATAWRWRSTA
jgi:hypothetical protein